MLNRKSFSHLLLLIITICSISCARQKDATAPANSPESAHAGEEHKPTIESKAASKTPIVPVTKSSPRTAVTDEYFSHMSLAYAAALKRHLAAKPGIRPAQISDYDGKKNNPLPGDTGNKTYHPYYAEGDFNNDGKPDYAVVLIDANRKRKLSVFNAAQNDGDSPEPVFTSGELADYDTLSFNEEYKCLIVAPVQSDNGYYLKPDGKGYKAVSLSDL